MRDFSDRIRLFVAVVSAGSFSAAGRNIGLTAGAISRAIDAFEADLGAKLLNRSTRRLSLTESGSALLPRARRILAEIEEAKIALQPRGRNPSGKLVVSASTGFGRQHIAPLLASFLRAYPKVQGELQLTDSVVDLVEGGIDIAVRVGKLPDSTLVASPLVPLRQILCASPAYLKECAEPSAVADLFEHDVVVAGSGEDRPAWLFATGQFHPAERRIRLRASNQTTAAAAVIAGLGLGYLAHWLIDNELAAGNLVRLLPDQEMPPDVGRGVHLVRLPGPHVPAKTVAFADHLRKGLSHLRKS